MSKHQPPGPIEDAMGALENAVDRLASEMGSPLFLPQPGLERFRFPRESPELVRVLKSVRLVSALNASRVLLREGLVAEVGVLFRTINEFLQDIDFLHVEADRDASRQQTRFVDAFFSDDLRPADELLEDERRESVPRKKIWSQLGRMFEPFSSFDRVRRLERATHLSLSGYVHGSYTTCMELFGAERFHLSGMDYPPRIAAFERQLAIHVSRSFNAIGGMALDLELFDLAEGLGRQRDTLERSDAYPGRS